MKVMFGDHHGVITTLVGEDRYLTYLVKHLLVRIHVPCDRSEPAGLLMRTIARTRNLRVSKIENFILPSPLLLRCCLLLPQSLQAKT